VLALPELVEREVALGHDEAERQEGQHADHLLERFHGS